MEWYDSVEAMAGASDLVVVGTITGFEPGRELAMPDPAAGSVHFVDAEVDVTEVLSGDASPSADLVVEFVTAVASADQLPAYLDELHVLVGHGDVVLFLRDKGTSIAGLEPLPEEAGLLRIVNSYALVTQTAEMPVDVPLGEVPDLDGQEVAEQHADNEVTEDPRTRWQDLDEFIAYLRGHLG